MIVIRSYNSEKIKMSEKKIRAIILAAGVGSRLRPITDHKPKTMVTVNNKPMISYIVESLLTSGIKHIIVCVGYRSEQLIEYLTDQYGERAEFNFVVNSAYETTNNMYSLYLARDFLHDDVILMNADLVFDNSIIKSLVENDGNWIAVDKGRYMEESMKVIVNNNRINKISKEVSREDSYGCSIDIYKFDHTATKILHNEIIRIIEEEEDLNQWTEVLLDNVFNEGLIVAHPMDIEGRNWFEIDNYDDLSNAELLFNKKLLTLSDKKAFILDKDGTISIGKTPVKGADNFISLLEEKNKKWVVGSNNSSKTSERHESGLREIFPLSLDLKVISSLDVTISELKRLGIKNLFWVANESVSGHLGEHFVYDDVSPEALLLTYDTEVNYEKFLKLISLIRKGYNFFATHIDLVCPTEEGDIPDIGSFIELIKKSTGVKPLKTFGKPSKVYLDYLLNHFNCPSNDVVLIGDRLYTDISFCEGEDITSILVLSGETSRSDYEMSDIEADIIVPSLLELSEYL